MSGNNYESEYIIWQTSMASECQFGSSVDDEDAHIRSTVLFFLSLVDPQNTTVVVDFLLLSQRRTKYMSHAQQHRYLLTDALLGENLGTLEDDCHG